MEKGISKYEKIFNVGDKFGKWIVTDSKPIFLNHMKEYSVKVKCDCDKGIERYVSCRKLKTGISWGCDCVRRKNNSTHWTGIGDLPGSYIHRIKATAKRKGIKLSINKKYIWDIFIKQNGKCALTGLDIKFGGRNDKITGTYDETTASLDRIDSSKGYIEGNVQWVHKDINIMKNDFSVDKFKELCKMIVSYGN